MNAGWRLGCAALASVWLLGACQSSMTTTDVSDAGAGDAAAPAPVRSSLYPTDWKPGFADTSGRFLHDFSYAGYRNGEVMVPETPPGLTYDAVAGYGADPTGVKDATAAIQAALQAASAAGGGVVLLPKGTYRCDGTLRVSKPGVVLRGAGPDQTLLQFTKSKGMGYSGHLTFAGTIAPGPQLPLLAETKELERVVRVADASTLQVGDDISLGFVITPAFTEEHGMTGIWTAFANQWKPIFRRRVVAVDTKKTPHEVTVDVPLRYPMKLRDTAALRRETGYVSECGVENLGISNAVAWADAWAVNQNHAIEFLAVKDCWIRKVRSFASPLSNPAGYHLQSSGILVRDSKRVTVSETDLSRAQNRGDNGNGYLYEVSTSNEVLFRDSQAHEGRHNFIQNWDFGTTGVVWQRVFTEGSQSVSSVNNPFSFPTASEFHHSLAMACLIDQSTIDDAWQAQNRQLYSTGAGHTSTQGVFWNNQGRGRISSLQYGWGYVIGTKKLTVVTDPSDIFGSGQGSTPEDYREHIDLTAVLEPASLRDDQLTRRLARGEKLW